MIFRLAIAVQINNFCNPEIPPRYGRRAALFPGVRGDLMPQNSGLPPTLAKKMGASVIPKPSSRRRMRILTKNCDASLSRAALIGVLSLGVALSAQSQSDESRSGQWRIAGQNLSNSWSQPAEHSISSANVNGLAPKWVFTTGGDVSATPTVDGDAVYFPDWGGNLFAVEKDSGRLIWSHKISEYDGVEGAISRVSPAVDGNQVIIGDILNSKQVHNGANVISVDRQTGTIQWMTQVDTHPAAIITGSPVVFHGMVYIGISSSEETLATDP